MACWFFVDDKTEDIDLKLKRFRNVFDIGEGFRLNTERISFGKAKNLILWSWNNLGEYPDIYHFYSNEHNVHLVLDGYITGFGKFGDQKGDPKESIQKLIQLYTEKREFVHELNGSFCIIIYDGNSDKLYFYNDRISSRPVWYTKEDQCCLASNLPSAIAAITRKQPSLSEIGLWSLLATGRHTGETGLFGGINNLPSGTVLSCNSESELSRRTWFNLKYSPDYSLESREWAERIAAELTDSAQGIRRNHQNVTLFLSGGMDSRIAAGAFGEGTQSVTLTTSDNMNSRLSEKVAKACNIDHETIYRDDYWYLKSLEHASLIASGNYKHSHAHFTSLFKRDEKYFKYTYAHGDMLENFNKHYFKTLLQNLDPRSIIKKFNQVYSYSVDDFNKLEQIFPHDYGKKIRLKWEEYALGEIEKYRPVSENREDVLDAFFRWQNTTVCPTYLMLENIRPFAGLANLMFDNRLLDTLLSIPYEFKSEGKLHNEILKNLNSRLRWIPNSNYWLPPVTPEPILQLTTMIRPYIGSIRRKIVRKRYREKKSPLVLTEGSWDMLHERYRFDEAYKSEINEMVSRTDFVDFDPGYLDHLLNEFHNGDISPTKEIEHIYSVNKLLSLLGY